MSLKKRNSLSTENEFLFRSGSGEGMWLTCLLPLSVTFGAWRFSSSVTFVYCATSIVAACLLCTTVLYISWSPPRAVSSISKLSFLLPPIAALFGVLYIHNEDISRFGQLSRWPKSSCGLSREAELFTGFLASLLGGVASSWPFLTGLPMLLTIAPGCFSFGEAVVVVQAITLFTYSSIVNISKVSFSRWNLLDDVTHQVLTATVILQVGLLGIFLLVFALIYFPVLRKCIPFYVSLISTTIAVVGILHLILGGSPVLWIFKLLRDNSTVLVVCYWVACSIAAVLGICYQLNFGGRASTSVRKVFHILAVAVFIPGIIFAPTLIYLASGVVLALFIVLEMVRVLNVSPFGHFLESAFSMYADEKDVLVAVTPIYLLCGCALPLWLFPGELASHSLIFAAGCLSVGLGDTAASIIGSKFGRLRWPGTPKTVEGTGACIAAQIAAVYLLAQLGYFVPTGAYQLQVVLAIAFVALVEAFSDQVDNLVMPLCAYLMFL